MDQSVVHVITDASLDEEVPISACAFCIVWPSGGVFKKAKPIMSTSIRDSTQAELIAVSQALAYLDAFTTNNRKSERPSKRLRIVLHIDNEGAIFHLQAILDGQYSKRSLRFAKLNKGIIDSCRLRLSKFDYEIVHIESHNNYAPRTKAHDLHDWCDRASRRQMRVARANLLLKAIIKPNI